MVTTNRNGANHEISTAIFGNEETWYRNKSVAKLLGYNRKTQTITINVIIKIIYSCILIGSGGGT